MKDLFDKYFGYWDTVLTEVNALDNLLDLFSNDVELKTHEIKVCGKDKLRQGFEDLIKQYVRIKHVWHVHSQEQEDELQATWAVAHELKNGEIHAGIGKDIMKVDSDGKIKYLEFQPYQDITKK